MSIEETLDEDDGDSDTIFGNSSQHMMSVASYTQITRNFIIQHNRADWLQNAEEIRFIFVEMLNYLFTPSNAVCIFYWDLGSIPGIYNRIMMISWYGYPAWIKWKELNRAINIILPCKGYLNEMKRILRVIKLNFPIPAQRRLINRSHRKWKKIDFF